MDAVELRRLLDYDPATGIFRWRVRTSSRAAAGDVAGFSRDDGYRLIGVKGRMYLVHRLAWLHTTGDWPAATVDHIDRDPTNNRFTNLRAASHSQNACNKAVPRNNTSGFKGVVWHKKSKVWQAQIKKRGKMYYLGSFNAPELAGRAYAEASKRLHGSFGRPVC